MIVQIQELRAALLMRGMTLADWARSRGHDPKLARRIAHRWADRPGLPRGPLTRGILKDLSKDLGTAIPPGMNWEDAA